MTPDQGAQVKPPLCFLSSPWQHPPFVRSLTPTIPKIYQMSSPPPPSLKFSSTRQLPTVLGIHILYVCRYLVEMYSHFPWPPTVVVGEDDSRDTVDEVSIHG